MVIRILEAVHGHLAILAVAGLIHPAVLLRKGKPMSWRTELSVLLTALMVVAAFSTGLLVYPAYQRDVRTALFLEDRAAGLLFETKEHLAFAVIATTIGAATCALSAPKKEHGLRRVAAGLFAIAAGLCILVAALGTYVASVRGFQ